MLLWCVFSAVDVILVQINILDYYISQAAAWCLEVRCSRKFPTLIAPCPASSSFTSRSGAVFVHKVRKLRCIAQLLTSVVRWSPAKYLNQRFSPQSDQIDPLTSLAEEGSREVVQGFYARRWSTLSNSAGPDRLRLVVPHGPAASPHQSPPRACGHKIFSN